MENRRRKRYVENSYKKRDERRTISRKKRVKNEDRRSKKGRKRKKNRIK